MAAGKEKYVATAKEMLSFINKSPSPFHAVNEIKKSLQKYGFQELKETEKWKITPMSKYYVTKNESTIIAFAVGGQYQPGSGFSIVGAHTDSPCLKVKPISKKTKVGFCQVGVECYGGGIWNTWFDRDLTVAGRVFVKEKETQMIRSRLVNLEKPILRIPHLAIHLQREMNDSFGINKENHLVPVLATCVKAELEGDLPASSESSGDDKVNRSQASKHSPTLVRQLCEKLSITPDQMMDFELCLADTQPAAVGGACEEFIFSPRLDNLFNAYTSYQGLLNSLNDGSLETDPNVRMISLFDNEEVGSQSAQGAGSTFQELVMRRINCGNSAFEESIGKSYMISADQAHGIHPNYSEKHEANHQPMFHKGIVIKFNANQRYATTGLTATILREIAAKADVPLQDVVVRNDSPCGSTIGPIMSAKLGMQTIDVGAAQLSMHSIREMGGTDDVLHAINLFESFFKNFPEVQSRIQLN